MNSEQLERESDRARQDLQATLDELRERISPGQVVDQLVEYARDGSGAEFVRNLKQQLLNNPLSVTMIGAGLAWLILGNGTKPESEHRTSSVANRLSGALETSGDKVSAAGAGVSGAARSVGASLRSAASSVSEAGRGLKGRISDLADSAAESLSGMAVSAKETTTATYDSAADAIGGVADSASRTSLAVADSARNISRGAAETSRSLVDFCREQPLVLAGIGVALGAALGAVLPATEAEARVMGEASDKAMDAVKDAAGNAFEKSVAVGERALEAAREEARKQGLTDVAEFASEPRSVGENAANQSTVAPLAVTPADATSDSDSYQSSSAQPAAIPLPHDRSPVGASGTSDAASKRDGANAI